MVSGEKKEHKDLRVAFRVFRDDLAKYLELLANGEEITVFNAKRNVPIVILKRVEKASK